MNEKIILTGINIILWILNPMLGNIYLNISMLKLDINKFKIILYSFFSTLLLLYLPIYNDVLGNFFIKEMLKKNYKINEIPINFYYHKLIILLEKIKFEYMHSFGVYIFFSIFFTLYIYYNISKDISNYSKIYWFIFNIYIFVLCNLLGFNRINLAIILLINVLYFKNYMLKIVVSIIAYTLHQGILPILLIIIFAKFFKLNFILKKRKLFIIIVVFYSILNLIIFEKSLDFILKIISLFLNPYFIEKVNLYLYSNWGILEFNLRILFKKFFEVGIPLLISFIYLLNLRKEKFNIKEKILFLFILFQIFLLRLNTISERYSIFSYLLLLAVSYENIYFLKNKQKIITTIFLAMILRFIIYNFYVYGFLFYKTDYDKINKNQEIKIEKIEKILYLNSFQLLNIEENGYNDLFLKKLEI